MANGLSGRLQARAHAPRPYPATDEGFRAARPVRARTNRHGRRRKVSENRVVRHWRRADEQIKHFIDHRIRASIGTVDLVDHHDRAQALFQRLAQHKFGLQHRAFCRIGQQNDSIGHTQYAFDLTAEIGMSRRIDNIDAHPFHITEVGLARIVMPRSFSKSPESINRSSTC